MLDSASSKSIAVLFLLSDCNMRCPFCITESRVETLSPSHYTQALHMLRARGFRHIVLGGGEPFAWPYGALGAAHEAKRMGFFVQIGTNGVFMPPEDACPEAVDRYVLPFDGASPAVHDGLRRFPRGMAHSSHFELILRRMEQLRVYQRPVTVSTVVTRLNLFELENIANLLADYVADGGRLHAWHLYRFLPSGRGGVRHSAAMGISESCYQRASLSLQQRPFPFLILRRPDMRHSASVDFFWREGGRLCAGSECWGPVPVPRNAALAGTEALVASKEEGLFSSR